MKRIYVGCVLLLAMTACQDAMEPAAVTTGDTQLHQGSAGIRGTPPPPQSHRLYITTGQLPEGHAGASYLAALTATGGNGPLSWTLVAGALPEGLTLAPEGALSGTPAAEATATFTVQVTDGAQRVRKELGLVIHPELVLATEGLPRATEGITWLAAPGAEVRLAAQGGKPPLTFSAEPLPPGLSLDARTGTFSGAPALQSAGDYAVTVRVSDAAGGSLQRTLPLEVRAARPVPGGGTASLPPRGSPLTDTLTVFVVDSAGRALANVGVRVRRNGREYVPPREALTGPDGKVVFTGLGLDGVHDTVDITANGKDLQNLTMASVNAALVTLAMWDWPLPMPRYDFVSAADPDSGRIAVTGGYNALGTWGCVDNVLELEDVTTNTWAEPVPPSMPGAMPTRVYGAGAFARGTLVVFGGIDCMDFTSASETWEYAPATGSWTRWDVGGPEIRNVPVMTPDGTGERVLLFGGFSMQSYGALDDLWVYTPATHTWEQRFPSGPRPWARSDAAATFDSLRGELVVCGGTGPFYADVADCHAYSPALNAWRPLPSLPAPRSDFGLAFHPGTGELYAFGGDSGGLRRNDVLVLRDGAWVTLVPDGAVGSPPRLHGHALVADARSGQLVLVGGARVDSRISGDVWTFDPATAQWTWRNAPPPSRPTVRLSGALSGGPLGTRIQATVTVVGDGGHWGRQNVTLVNGAGQYALDVPVDETLSVSAYVTDRARTPVVLWSYADLGVMGPLAASTALDIAFPPGPLPLNTTTATFALPDSWASVDSLSGSASRLRPGFLDDTNGLARADLGARSLRFDTFPLAPGTTQRFTAVLGSTAPQTCATAWLYWEGATTQPVPVPALPTGLAPGVSECLGASPTVAEETWAVTPSEGAKLLWVGIGGDQAPDDWLYLTPAAGSVPVTFRLPEPSTLAPSRPMPRGQRASWYLDTAVFSASPFDYDDFSLTFMQPDAFLRIRPYVYVRP